METRCDVRIVLVQPRDPNNIGAAARAMANFGLGDLVVVSPYEPTWREARSAIGASQVIKRARVVDTLAEAIADRTFVGAATSGTRRRLAGVMSAEQFAAEASGHARVALLFGNEKRGLSAADIARCHAAVRIATSTEQPSMNLAQAVAVCCYEWNREEGGGELRRVRRERIATLQSIERLVDAAVPDDGDVRTSGRRAALRDRLRAMLLRSRASEADVAMLRGLVAPGRRRG